MTEPHRAVVARLSADVAALSQQLARVTAGIAVLDRMLAERPAVPPTSYFPTPPPQYQAPPPVLPMQAPVPPAPKPMRDEGWVGKLLAVAGVAVTLVGIVLLLVLAAQAGILRPEMRVAGGAVLASVLVGAAVWLNARPGGRTGAIALAATGIAGAYMDVVAATTIYGWLAAPVGLVLAAAIGGGGLTMARRWDSEHLGLLVLVPLLVLAPVVAGGISLLLVGYMLTLAAASLPVQLGKDWLWLHAARIAASTLPLLIALLAVHFDDGHGAWLAGACGIAAVLAIASALILGPQTANRAVLALLTSAGTLPVLCAALAVDRVAAALMAAALAAAVSAVLLAGQRCIGGDRVVRAVWVALSAVSAVTAVLLAFDGYIAGPVLLGMALVVAIAGRRLPAARWTAAGFTLIGGGLYLSYAPPFALVHPVDVPIAHAASTLVTGLLLTACATVLVWSLPRRDNVAWGTAAGVALYTVTTSTVTAGVLIGGQDGGFLAGHMAATICWIAVAAALFGHAVRLPRPERSLPIGGGLALVAVAMAKLFLFDLGTLDGIFRVTVFIVVGLILLGTGATYARMLAKQDEKPTDVMAGTR
ncbi:DUF2339 domain-containing protein [Mycobacterium sp. IDR2000157661]|uniref:DUF2339 domain-containing protein n=1 Tax=Mycobacterium sp. IDR2000157661 TaxID=2867005 RepID=UPI001EEBCC07|nr:DUF2339 domain-containing protein [Mycobacterium sp. IDR2000157661]ULE32619.1 DUF2339 domain-containing protein [Mycobacterium sp. IDR2000157661]